MAALPIAVLGSGPAGSACAIELLSLGHAVVLIDKGAEGKERRGETCGPRVRQILLGQGTAFTAACHQSFGTYSSAWGTSVMEGRQIAFWQAGEGSVLDRSTLHNDLVASARGAGAVVLSDCHVQVAQWTGQQWVLQGVQDGKPWKLAARFVVEATGRQSSSACQPDAKRIFLDKLQCLVMEFAAVAGCPPGVIIESAEVGWWYTVGLPTGRQVLAFFTDADLVAPQSTRIPWLNTLLCQTKYMHKYATAWPPTPPLYVRDARTSMRNVFWRGSWITAGDAAWSMDPISGNGIERALLQGVATAQAVATALETNQISSLKGHALAQVQAFKQALGTQRGYYNAEKRWPNSLFWRRRV